MGQRDILGRNAEKDVGRRIRNLATATPLARTSVTDGHTEFNGNESLLVKGSQKVSGWLVVTGWLKVVGTLLMEGFLSITGNVTATGIWNQNGPWNLAGAGGITGDVASTGTWTQSGTYTVAPGGKIIVQGPAAATLQDGELSFATGGKLVAYPSGISAKAGAAELVASIAGAFLFFGTNKVSVTSGGTYVSGNCEVSQTMHARGALYNEGIALKAGAANNLHIDSNGRIWKTS